jgi:SAM-dependent methyltransferase/ADP-ribose pyrophosphatase YjhB (NUDIX family)
LPDLTSAALVERDDKVLVAHRRRPPVSGQWTLPIVLVRDDEAAEDALRRHAQAQFGVGLGEESFVETIYLVDPDDRAQYVANIFRTPIVGGPMRFNAQGDYDDARWLAAADLDALWMPPDLRVPLMKILTEPESLHLTDWDRVGDELASQGVPLAERDDAADAAPLPDNRAGWDAIAARYQAEVYGDRFGDAFMWSWSLSEDDARLLDDVHGKRALVLGCGGGQDCVSLVRMGAIAVGVDQSEKQIEYARKHAAERDATNASFVAGNVEDLSRFDDASFDLAVAAHMLNYVERIDATLRETARVLKPGAPLAFSVRHPADVMLTDRPPLRVEHAYWDAQRDWSWTFEGMEPVRFRQWFWTVADWCRMLDAAGFAVERILEPQEAPAPDEDDADTRARRALVPYTLLMKARKR